LHKPNDVARQQAADHETSQTDARKNAAKIAADKSLQGGAARTAEDAYEQHDRQHEVWQRVHPAPVLRPRGLNDHRRADH